MSNKTLQQTDKEFEVKQKILKEIEELDFDNYPRLYESIERWQSQLKNLSKKEKPEKVEKLEEWESESVAPSIMLKINEIIERLNNL